MNDDLDSGFLINDPISFKKNLKNNKKIRVGIMLNDYRVEAWEYKMLEAIKDTEYASIELLILNESRNDKVTYFDEIIANRKKLFYSAYTELENKIIQRKPDAFAPTNSLKLLENVPVITTKPNRDTNYDWIQEEDIERINEYNLDVIILCGFQILKGNILNAAKYGLWSYFHDDNTMIKGGPPGFWETFERMHVRGAILQKVTENSDNGNVLYRSSFQCDSLFVSKNNNDCFLRSSLFVPRTLKKLYYDGEHAFLVNIDNENKKLTFYDEKLYAIPTNLKFLMMFIKHAYRIGANLISLNFFQKHWMLMYDLHDQFSTSFWRFKKIIPPRDRFWADPHVFFKDNTYFIFIEEYIYKKKKAHISLIEMTQSGKFSDPVKVLEEPFHLSYPHVFEYNNTLYMIPETRQAKSINLYECTGFPTDWKHRATLIDSVSAVDSTILFYKNKWWLFSNLAEPEGTSYNELFLFYSDNLLSLKWNSHPMNPVISDVKRARSAGKIIERNGRLYRPSQCDIPHYGYGIKLNEIVVLTENDYLEKEIAFIEPKWDKKLKGVHTLCHENRLTIIDGYYNSFFL
jgi:hypothetical protein